MKMFFTKFILSFISLSSFKKKYPLMISLLSIVLLGGAELTPKPTTYPMKAIPLAKDIYAILSPARTFPDKKNKGWNSNSAFIVTQEGVLLFDTGSSTTIGESLKKTIASITDKPVKWIINSHSHGDHWLGNAAFKDSATKYYASPEVSEKIMSEGFDWVSRFNSMTGGATGDSEVFIPEDLISEKSDIIIGGKKIIIFPSNDSHSKGDLILWIPDEKILFCGDVMYSKRMPSTFSSNITNWISMLGELESLNPKKVVPGHGSITDKKGITRLRMLLTTYKNEVWKQTKKGKTAEQMIDDVKKALSKFQKEFPGIEDKIKRDIHFVHQQALDAMKEQK